MIHLYIDKQEVVLSEDTEIDFYVYNPFFERKGEFTYDIDVNLSIPKNARLYSHLNRHNNKVVQQKRLAEIFNGTKCLVRGTEVILSVEDNMAKIQIVSGNSELNYLAAEDDVTMQDLEMGSLSSTLTAEVALQSLYADSSTFDFVCTPVGRLFSYFPSDQGSDKYSRDYAFNALYRPDHNAEGDFSLHYIEGTPLRAQPYLVSIVERVCQALGYKVTGNVLRSKWRWKNVAIVNTKDTIDFNKMVPNWKVNDFLTAVEDWCNVIFVNDRQKKEVRIVDVVDFYQNYSSDRFILDKHVVEGTDKTFSNETSQNVNYENIAYKFPAADWYRYACFDESLFSSCKKVRYPSYHDLVNAGVDLAAEYDKKQIYVTEDTGVYYVIRKRTYHTGSGAEGTAYFFYPVMTLRSVFDANSDDSMQFNIIPTICLMLYVGGNIYNIDRDRTQSIQMSASIPISLEDTSSDKDIEVKGLNDYIVGGMPEANVSSVMCVFQYAGVQPCFWFGSYTASEYPQTAAATVYPRVAVVQYMMNCYAYNYYEGQFQYSMHQVIDEGRSLAPASLKAGVYSQNQKIDTSKVYKIKFFADEIYDAKDFFFIKNLKLYCKRLLYKINLKGVRRVVEGEFFPVR